MNANVKKPDLGGCGGHRAWEGGVRTGRGTSGQADILEEKSGGIFSNKIVNYMVSKMVSSSEMLCLCILEMFYSIVLFWIFLSTINVGSQEMPSYLTFGVWHLNGNSTYTIILVLAHLRNNEEYCFQLFPNKKPKFRKLFCLRLCN